MSKSMGVRMKWVVGVLSVAGSLTASAVEAQTTYEFTATVADVDDSSGLLGGTIAPGTVFTGTYTIDLNTRDSHTAPTVADYWHYTAPYGITVNGGGWTFKTDPANTEFLVEITNDHGTPPSDDYLLGSYRNLPLSESVKVRYIFWHLGDPTASALSNTRLSSTPPDLSLWQSMFGLTIEGGINDELGIPGPHKFFIRAHVTRVKLSDAKLAFTGFFAPIENAPTTNAVKAGSAVPLRFSLGGDAGLNIFADGFPVSQQIACDTGAPIEVIEETVNAGASSLSYNAATGQYIYVWKTDESWFGCRELQLKLNDGETYRARFTIRK